MKSIPIFSFVHCFSGKGCIGHKCSTCLALFFLLFLTGFSSAQTGGLFENEEVFTITLSGDLAEVLRDRSGDPQYRFGNLRYTDGDSSVVTIPIRLRTRGNFRRAKGICSHPPLLLNFRKEDRKKTIFAQQDRLKLVMPCQGESFLIREYHVYKLYNLMSPKSFQAKLVKVVLDDPKLKPKEQGPFYGILLEEEEQMAERNGMVAVEKTLVRPEQTQLDDFLNMAVFNYLIGNTDWSVQYRQNVKLIAIDSMSKTSTVPYDFDHSGIVRAPYAKPAAELLMSSVRERRYRGFCIDNMAHFDKVIAHFNTLKEPIYAVYSKSAFLDQKYIQSTLKYLDAFYAIINNPKKVKQEFQYPCKEDGTGHVVIKGLRN
ncbi:hypothetical protein SAMN05444412_10961 [Rhodonellum ikkaensis]|nr:hypothetical protein SAMN05444412_10961 [Rhodonellum ikkaensis]